MALGWLGSAVRTAASLVLDPAPVLDAAREFVDAPTGRRCTTSGERAHLEMRGLHATGGDDVSHAVRRRLESLEGVRAVEVNAALGRVVVTHDPDTVSTDALAAELGDLEDEHGLGESEPAPAGVDHPGEPSTVLHEASTLVGAVVGLGYATATSLLPVRTLPPAVSAVLSLTDSVPWMRDAACTALGRRTTDVALAAGGVMTQALGQNPVALVTNACQRACTAREATARRQAWLRWDRELAEQPGTHDAPPLPVAARPTPLPIGPVEDVANTSGTAALGGYAATLALTRSPQRSLATLIAGTPRAARSGREAFAATLAGTLSDRGVLVFDPASLRRLDRVDAVVLDADLLTTGRSAIRDVTALVPEEDETLLYERAHELVDPNHPERARSSDEWSCDVPDLATLLDIGAPGDVSDAGTTRVLLRRDGRAVALVELGVELAPLAEALVDAAATVGRVLVAGGPRLTDRPARLAGEWVTTGEDGLAGPVRELQRAGHAVLGVSGADGAALAACDVGIGVPPGNGAGVPWEAHVLCPDLASAHTLLAAADDARTVSARGAQLAVAGSCAGAVFGWFGPALGAPFRAGLPVNTAALFALGTGAWTGLRAADRPAPAGRQDTAWHAVPPETALSLLSSSPDGLSSSDATRRLPPATDDGTDGSGGIGRATLESLVNPMTPVLGVGAVVSAGLGSVIDAVMITSVVAGSALIDAAQSVTTRRQLSRLLDGSELAAWVRRDGGGHTVAADRLVPGDVVELRAGDCVPADCRLLSAESLEVDEASLTGESHLVVKSAEPTWAPALAERSSMLYQGTVVTTGQACAVVVATGADTEAGRTAGQGADGPRRDSGVSARLSELTKNILPLSTGAGVTVLLLDLLRASPPGQAFSRAVGLAVAAVPEGLPFVATVAELAAARRLSDHGVLVRGSSTVEALGRVDTLCFDKTGTLTQGMISLRHVSDGSRCVSVDELGDGLREVLAAAVRASPRQDDDVPLAHPTDRAVLAGADRAGITAETARRGEPQAELAFEPSRGFHAVRTADSDGPRLSVKGAPESVFDRCCRRRVAGGHRPFDAAQRAEVEDEVQRLALDGYRVLAVAERTSPDRDGLDGNGLDESDVDDLDLVGLLALADPVHPTAARSVAELRRGGVEVTMITGDHPSTAEAVAAELDMLAGRRVAHGAELDALDDDQLAAELPKIAVFARVSPTQKARIVRLLDANGRVVAMTGDGANDVPAIRLAHVGIAAGTSATPSAREAADLVIADDRIETIGHALIEGRGMWASVHDALAILLGGNLGEIGYSVATGLFGGGSLNIRQLLVVNLLTDVLPALAIAIRPPPEATAEDLLAEGPEASLGGALTRDVYARAAATAGAAGAAWLLTRPVSTAGQARTAGLVALVSAQLVQTVAVRGRTPLVLGATLASLLALAVIVQVPGVSQVFGSQPLLPHQWFTALGTAVAAACAVVAWQAWSRPAVASPQ